MANIPTKTFAQYVTDQVTAIQAASSALIDFTVGSILRAIVEANASISIWFQGLLVQVLTITRAATSSGADLDSWCADYSFYRLPAVAASGQVTFARFSNGISAFIPVGTQIQTSDSSAEVFLVVADTANVAYSAALGGYTINAGVSSLIVPVQAAVAGAAGNVLAGQCNVLTQSIPGVDTVTNASPFTNGADAESDSSFRTRFIAYIGSLSRGTKQAIISAITGIQQGVQYSIKENYAYGGTAQPGYFYVVADDGSGSPSGSFLSSVNNAIDAVRGFTISFGVFAPVVTNAAVVMTVTVAAGYDATAVKAAVSSALQTQIDIAGSLNSSLRDSSYSLTFPYTKLAQIAYEASPGVLNVSAVTLNGGTSDLTADNKHVIRATTPTVN